jgi:hypothetical protein
MTPGFRIPPNDAYFDMMAKEIEAGVDPRIDPPPPPGPPEQSEPLIRYQPPPPDWRKEELELARRKAAENAPDLEPEQSPYPAKPKPSPKAETRTPNLDKVLQWKGSL